MLGPFAPHIASEFWLALTSFPHPDITQSKKKLAFFFFLKKKIELNPK